MRQPSPPLESAWITQPRAQALLLWILAAVAAGVGWVSICKRDNDFLWHRNHGTYFLQGKESRDHYLPARSVMNIPLALGPYRPTRASVFVLSLLLLLVCYHLWNRMAARTEEVPTSVARAAGLLAIVFTLPYLLRDLDDCGLQIILLFFLTMSGYALSTGKSALAGFWLATAASYKVTPLVGLPFLLWKRQWQAAGWTVLFLGFWTAVPSLYSGWDNNLRAHERWWAESVKIKSFKQAYPSLIDREPPKISNVSLYAGIARFLETYPDGHELYLDHPYFMQFGSLSPLAAYYALHAILAVLGLAYLWCTRRPWMQPQGAHTFPGEWASFCVFCALLSPLCWKQHLVLVLACHFLITRRLLAHQCLRGKSLVLLTAIASMSWLTCDDVVGRTTCTLLLSYKLDTIAVLLGLVWTMALPRCQRIEQAPQLASSADQVLTRAA